MALRPPGFVTFQRKRPPGDAVGSLPTDMVHVPAADFQLFHYLKNVHIDDFWMDKYEVTNRQFKEFIDNGGYSKTDYWREPFIRVGRTLSWKEAMAKFVDSTGRPGPAAWEVSHYPAGQDDFPVTGVSWYEAAAYAVFAKKQLPTVHQWYLAANQNIYSDILKFSNFSSKGTLRVGSLDGLGPSGTYDMAGNAAEWSLNAAADRRFILGGAWNEVSTSYLEGDVLWPFDRAVGNGFRCVINPKGPLPEVMTRPIDTRERDHRNEKPISDAAFRILERFYSYDHGPTGRRDRIKARGSTLAGRRNYPECRLRSPTPCSLALFTKKRKASISNRCGLSEWRR